LICVNKILYYFHITLIEDKSSEYSNILVQDEMRTAL